MNVVMDWSEALQEAWRLAVGERANELRGKRVRRFDDQGLHPNSSAWGRVRAFEAVEPFLRELTTDPVELRQEAEREAESAYEDERFEAWSLRRAFERSAA